MLLSLLSELTCLDVPFRDVCHIRAETKVLWNGLWNLRPGTGKRRFNRIRANPCVIRSVLNERLPRYNCYPICESDGTYCSPN